MCNNERLFNDRLRSYHSALVDRLEVISGNDDHRARQFADDVCRLVMGKVPDLDAHTNPDDGEAWELLLSLEGVTASVDVIASVFVVEKIKMLGGLRGWQGFRLLDDMCRLAFGPEAYVSLDDDQTQELLLRVENVFALIGEREEDPLPIEVMAAILDIHRI